MNEDLRRRNDSRAYANREPVMTRRAVFGWMALAIFVVTGIVLFVAYDLRNQPGRMALPSYEPFRNAGTLTMPNGQKYEIMVGIKNPDSLELVLLTNSEGQDFSLSAEFSEQDNRWNDMRRCYTARDMTSMLPTSFPDCHSVEIDDKEMPTYINMLSQARAQAKANPPPDGRSQ